MASNGGEMVGAQEAGRLLGIHHSTVRRKAREGLIPGFRLDGGHYRFRRSELEEYLTARRTAPPVEAAS